MADVQRATFCIVRFFVDRTFDFRLLTLDLQVELAKLLYIITDGMPFYCIF